MPTPDLYPLPFSTLVSRMARELSGDAIYALPRRDWWTPVTGLDTSIEHFGTRCATPAGPASGPHTQLAQNLLLSFLAGGRFHELKTVQVLDELELPRPCIDVPHIGYNVEWSQELRVPQSAMEYAKGWWLIHMLCSELGPGLWPSVDCMFDISVGYDLAGLRSDKVRLYVEQMRDASDLLDRLAEELRGTPLAPWADVPCPSQISDSVTISTFHGCPASEIEAIATQCLEWDLHTVVKLNPTLLGFDRVRGLLDRLGYDYIGLDPHAFEKDMQWDQLAEMVPRLQALAQERGRGFGVKLSNTLVCQSDEPSFPDVDEMYLSGPPLHVVTVAITAELRRALGADLPVTFSAGVDRKNFAPLVGAGIGPVTTCSDLLKGKGYARMTRYVRDLEREMTRANASSLAQWRPRYAAGLGIEGPDWQLELTDRIAAVSQQDKRYTREANRKPPPKVGSQLVLLDCLTCDKCIPVCPNAANFAIPLPVGTYTPGRLRWDGAAHERGEGEPLIVGKAHQIGTCGDACNLCGQCDVWCPEDGGPYIVKPTLFVDPQAFADHPGRDGFHLSPDRRTMRWRRGKQHYTWRSTGVASGRFEVDGGAVELVDDAPVSTEGRGDVDLRIAVTMRLFQNAFAQPDAPVWLAPIEDLA